MFVIESDEDRREARLRARAAATPGDWLEFVLDHHLEIEEAFVAVREARSAADRREELEELAIVLTGHANAEESVLYPALAGIHEKGHATQAYAEQAAAKIDMAMLEELAPMSQEFLDKLEQIRSAVAHHMFEEEGSWFLELKSKVTDQGRLTTRYMEEFDRYVGSVDELLDDEDVLAPEGGASKSGSRSMPLR